MEGWRTPRRILDRLLEMKAGQEEASPEAWCGRDSGLFPAGREAVVFTCSLRFTVLMHCFNLESLSLERHVSSCPKSEVLPCVAFSVTDVLQLHIS